MLIHSHPTGNTFSRAASQTFYEHGILQEFHTCISWDLKNTLFRQLFPSLDAQFRRRTFSGIPRQFIHTYPWRELFRLLGISCGFSWLNRHEYGPFSVDGVYRSLDRHVAKRLLHLAGIHAVYGYEDGALHTFRTAKFRNIRCIYDLPIGYWRAAHQIYLEESELQPDWACTLTGLKDSPAKLARKDEELALADAVVVPSAFVRSTLENYQSCKATIHVVPFGSPPPIVYTTRRDDSRPKSPLRILYVGSLGQRKGLSYCLDAVESLGKSVVLTLIGRPTTNSCEPLNRALNQHNWIETLPHSQILGQMRKHDVLIFSTLFDGFGLVITEALSQGLPVITTMNSGGPECIRDGTEGFIVPIRSSEAIAERLNQLANNRDQLSAMREACLRRAKVLSWLGYKERLIDIVSNTLSVS